MIDHLGFSVSDYARAKAFYERALAPLGYTLVMEASAEATGQPAAGFGIGGKPELWIGGEGKLEKPVHIAIVAKDRPIVDAHYHSNYYAAFVFDPDGHNIEAVCHAPA
jgi:catechol 2,3-dioxygenase-like lactoylglutathione lyase family enzyme